MTLGIETNDIDLMWSNKSTLDNEAVITVVSDSGDICPYITPEITAPATSGRQSKLVPIPIIAMPAVPADPKDVPVAKEVIIHIINAVTKERWTYDMQSCVNNAWYNAANPCTY